MWNYENDVDVFLNYPIVYLNTNIMSLYKRMAVLVYEFLNEVPKYLILKISYDKNNTLKTLHCFCGFSDVKLIRIF